MPAHAEGVGVNNTASRAPGSSARHRATMDMSPTRPTVDGDPYSAAQYCHESDRTQGRGGCSESASGSSRRGSRRSLNDHNETRPSCRRARAHESICRDCPSTVPAVEGNRPRAMGREQRSRPSRPSRRMDAVDPVRLAGITGAQVPQYPRVMAGGGFGCRDRRECRTDARIVPAEARGRRSGGQRNRGQR